MAGDSSIMIFQDNTEPEYAAGLQALLAPGLLGGPAVPVREVKTGPQGRQSVELRVGRTETPGAGAPRVMWCQEEERTPRLQNGVLFF